MHRGDPMSICQFESNHMRKALILLKVSSAHTLVIRKVATIEGWNNSISITDLSKRFLPLSAIWIQSNCNQSVHACV